MHKQQCKSWCVHVVTCHCRIAIGTIATLLPQLFQMVTIFGLPLAFLLIVACVRQVFFAIDNMVCHVNNMMLNIVWKHNATHWAMVWTAQCKTMNFILKSCNLGLSCLLSPRWMHWSEWMLKLLMLTSTPTTHPREQNIIVFCLCLVQNWFSGTDHMWFWWRQAMDTNADVQIHFLAAHWSFPKLCVHRQFQQQQRGKTVCAETSLVHVSEHPK